MNTKQSMMSLDNAIRTLRNDPRYRDTIYYSYLTPDIKEAAGRFFNSAEFTEVQNLLGPRIRRSKILDLGAGIGIASFAFARAGAQIVYALEPDPSDLVGRGALERIRDQLPIEILDAVGEDIPLPDESVDVVYVRQVLHHIRDLPQALKECARVLKHDGVFLACREHVVDDEQQLAVFLQQHPVHQLAGGENAYPLDAYLTAIKSSGLKIAKVLAPWQSIINAFPEVKTRDELKRLPRTRLSRKLGVLGSLLGYLPGVNTLMWKRISRPVPGRMYSFLAIKP